MYLRSASPTNAWQARRGFSGLSGMGTYRRRSRRGLRGLGDDSIFDVGILPTDTSSIDTTSLDTLPNPFQALDTGSFAMPAPLAPTTTNYPTITPPAISSTSSPIASLFSMSAPATPSVATPAQPSLISAISSALGLTKAVTGAATKPAAPAGYAYNAAGQLVPVASSSLASGGGTLLLLGVGVFAAFALMGGRK
jgi:hypothetical protein